MAVQAHPDSLLGCLAALPDPRRRQGRRYPLSAILGLVLMGMLHGRDSLRGGWVWARQHWGCCGAHSAAAVHTSRPTIRVARCS